MKFRVEKTKLKKLNKLNFRNLQYLLTELISLQLCFAKLLKNHVWLFFSYNTKTINKT